MILNPHRGSSVQNKINFLLQVDEFKDYDPAWLHLLAEQGYYRTYNSRDVLFRQNEVIQAAVFVVSGELALYKYFDSEVPYTKLSTIRIKKECDLRGDNQYHTQTRLFRRLSKLVDNRLETPKCQKKLLKKTGPHQLVALDATSITRFSTWPYEAVALEPTRCLLINRSVFQQLERIKQEGTQPTLLTETKPRRVSFAQLMDQQIRTLDSLKHRSSSVSVRRKPHLNKDLNFLSKLYRKAV